MRTFAVDRVPGFLVISALLVIIFVAMMGLYMARVLDRRILAQEERHAVLIARLQAQLHLDPSDFALPRPGGQRERFEAFLRGLPEAFRIKLFDRTGTVIWSNEPRFIGQRFPHDPHVTRGLRGNVAMILRATGESESAAGNGKRYVANTYVPIVRSGSPEVLGLIEVHTDITRVVLELRQVQRRMWAVVGVLGALLYGVLVIVGWRSRSDELLTARQLQAEKRREALGELTAVVAHELKSPLSVITARTKVLRILADRQVPGAYLSTQLATLEDAATRMIRVVRAMSTYSTPSRPVFARLNVNELLSDTQELVAQQAHDRRVIIELNAPESLPPVLADRSRLMQVLLHLVTNAIEAMAGTGGRLTLKAFARDGSNGMGGHQPAVTCRSVRVEISDTGPGIPPEDLSKIWEAFYTTKPEGTGLGLSIVRSLVAEQPGAAIEVESRHGLGTTFILSMPVAERAFPEAEARELVRAVV